MPIMEIRELFIHDGINHDDYRKFRWAEGEGSDTGEQQSDIYGAGNVRTLETLGAITTLRWTIRGVTLEDWLWLREHRGRFSLVRDSRGIREYGSYSSIPWKHWPNPRIMDIDLQFTAVTFDETV